jgi:GDP-4-dehydro-6-deoxy-D-mannose reductase
VRSLITGVGGFVGQFLAAHLAENGHAVVGLARREVAWHVLDAADGTTVAIADLATPRDLNKIVADAAPDEVYHLAAHSSVADSFHDPLRVLHNNVDGLVNLLEALRLGAPTARVLVISSSEIYGRNTTAGPVNEHAELRPENPYAVSKAAQDLIGYQYWCTHNMHVVRVRPFNHIGPGQSDRFVASSFAKQIAEIEAGGREPVLRVGNLEARRDFTDVRDMVRAYGLALERGDAGAAYNIGRGHAVSIQYLVDYLCSRSRAAINIEVDPSRLRRVDAPIQVSDSSRFHERTGWQPELPLEKTLDDMLDYWRTQVGTS